MASVSPSPDSAPSRPLKEANLPESNAVTVEAEMPLPSDPQTFFLGGIFALGVFAALYVASAIILPIVLALC
jgi:hypothetical protein